MGLLYPLRPQPELVGSTVANREFVAAFSRHAAASLELFVPRGFEGLVRAELGRPRPGVRVRPYSADLADFDFPFLALHELGLGSRLPLHLREALGRRFPVTYTTHSFSVPQLRHDFFLPLVLGGMRTCDAIVCTSRAARKATAYLLDEVAARFNRRHGTRARFEGRLVEIPLGVDTARFRPRPTDLALRRRLGIPPRAVTLTWLGRTSERAKADLVPLIRVFARLRRSLPARIHLVIAGCSSRFHAALFRREAAELGVGSSLTILPVSEATEVLSASDVLVMPADSIQENFGLAPLEALAAGVPQVVSDWGGYRDIVAHGETGFLVPTYWTRCDEDVCELGHLLSETFEDHLVLAQSVAVDVGALEQALRQLVDRPELRKRMAAASRARAMAQFEWSRVMGRYLALWRELSKVALRRAVPSDARGHDRPSYFDSFQSFAGRVLTPSSRVRLASADRQMRTRLPALGSPYPHGSVSRDRLERLLRRPGLASAGGLAIGPLADAPSELRHLMWLIKYGFLEVMP